MGKKRKHLSHEEIWDDSALVNSWNEALEEYKLYHSIHAKGERVEDVIKDDEDTMVEPVSLNGQAEAQDQVAEEDEEFEDGECMDDEEAVEDASAVPDAAADQHGITEHPSYAQDAAATATVTPSLAMPIPSPFPPQVQDEALKNLMMSWYWSGYYTGFYQGQQAAQTQSTS